MNTINRYIRLIGNNNFIQKPKFKPVIEVLPLEDVSKEELNKN